MFYNTYCVEVLKEELLLVVFQKLEMAVAEAAMDVLYRGKGPNEESPSSKDVLSTWTL